MSEPFISQDIVICWLYLPGFPSDQISNMDMIDYRSFMDYGGARATLIYIKYCLASSTAQNIVATYYKLNLNVFFYRLKGLSS